MLEMLNRNSDSKEPRCWDHHFLTNLLTKEEANQEVNSLTLLTPPSRSLVNLDSFNSLVKLLRTKNPVHLQSRVQERSRDDLWSGEMALALLAVVKADQMVRFEADYRTLSNGQFINPRSSIASLYPFMVNGVIRVGGRLAHGYSMTQ